MDLPRRPKGAIGLGKSAKQRLEYSPTMSDAEFHKYVNDAGWDYEIKLKREGKLSRREISAKVNEYTDAIFDRRDRDQEKLKKKPEAKKEEPKKEKKPRQKRDLSSDSRAAEQAARERRTGKPVANSRSEAAWNGLVTYGVSTAYSAIMKDANQRGYDVSKTEAARTAKKYKKPGKAVERARAHHGLAPPTPRKKSKKE